MTMKPKPLTEKCKCGHMKVYHYGRTGYKGFFNGLIQVPTFDYNQKCSYETLTEVCDCKKFREKKI